MADLDAFIFVVVPIGVLVMCGIGWIVARVSEKRAQKHVDRLVQLRNEN